ncbi:MAG: penicillin-binding protein [Polyangiaceae bacterium]|nr:penicillin-binding protein [Polyangiaceae bacterium]
MRVGLLGACAVVAAVSLVDGAVAAPSRVDLRHAHASRGKLVARDPASGADVPLTLDPDLQRAAHEILSAAKAHEGAIVMSDVRTGRVLVWATRGGGADVVATPIAPSASVFKVVTAAALLETGRVSRGTRQCYSGGERVIEEDDLDDDRARDDRCTTLGDALGHSVNLVFARMALKHLSPSTLRDEAAELGIGSEIPIDVRVPASTLRVPEDRLGFARAAAGFWNGKLSPLSALFLMQTIANRGERVGLRVLDEPGEARAPLGRAMSQSTASALVRMLEVTTRTGTSAKVFRHEDGTRVFPKMSVAGKTGTLIGGSPRRMYSWFAGFAPSRHPEVALSVLLANDVRWWKKGNEVARDMLEAYVAHKK